MKLFEQIILDADICIKLGSLERVSDTLYRVISQITDKAYIHQYVNEEEVLTKRNQLERLISENIVEVLKPDVVLINEDMKNIYSETKRILFKELVGEEQPRAAKS